MQTQLTGFYDATAAQATRAGASLRAQIQQAPSPVALPGGSPLAPPTAWYVAVEDVSRVRPGPDGQETGYALLDLAIYDVH